MRTNRSRPGYVFLMTVLFAGILSLAAVTSLLLLSWASEQSSLTFSQSTQALSMANSCGEYALRMLRLDPFYAGQDTLVFDQRGTCDILGIARAGDARVICSEGTSGSTKRRLEIRIQSLFPTPIISSYKETTDSNACL